MSTRHPQITRPLGDGWSILWDTTEVDAATERAMRRIVEARTDELKALLAPSFERASVPLDAPAARRPRAAA